MGLLISLLSLAIRYDIVQRRQDGQIVLVGVANPAATNTGNSTAQTTKEGEEEDVMVEETAEAETIFRGMATGQNLTIATSQLEFKNGKTPVSGRDNRPCARRRYS